MNCHPFRATQKSIPDAQELIWLGGGIRCPPPSVKGLMITEAFAYLVSIKAISACSFCYIKTQNRTFLNDGFKKFQKICNLTCPGVWFLGPSQILILICEYKSFQ